MALIDNLNAINDCKKAIKQALINKKIDMSNVAFSDYAVKIEELQLESGDGGSDTPVVSADYIYTNAFLTGGTRKDIANLEAYAIELDNDTCTFNLTCAPEYAIYAGGENDYDIVFTVEVPETYEIIKSVWINEAAASDADREVTQELEVNPRYATITRNGVTYNSFIRDVGGIYMMAEVNISDVQYIITIKKI